MVQLTRIVTKTGDGGETALGDGRRLPKDDPRIEAIGAVDELNAVLGLLLAHDPHLSEHGLLQSIQNDLFDVGADLCLPAAAGEAPGKKLRVQASQAERLEHAVDRINPDLKPLTSFVLPGGSPAAAWCHFARTVSRRAERSVVTLMRTEAINPQVLVYLNRLSDLLFVLARHFNREGRGDVLWQPGAEAAPS
jgi:cob(I)alamin adenosyltransferase